MFITNFENNFNNFKYVEFFFNNYWIPNSFVFLYMIFCYYGPKIMENKKAYDLKHTLAFWNGFLALFSFIGIIRTVPAVLQSNLSFKDNICSRDSYDIYRNGPGGFWFMLFVLSKIPELIDTVFIILRKRKLIFLHWYHHITVLFYCWNSYSNKLPNGVYFACMNYFIHAIMYGYYCTKALNICPKNFPSHIITTLQTTQMFIGSGICYYTWYNIYYGDCEIYNIFNLIFGSIMYLSYFYLFLEFALKRRLSRH